MKTVLGRLTELGENDDRVCRWCTGSEYGFTRAERFGVDIDGKVHPICFACMQDTCVRSSLPDAETPEVRRREARIRAARDRRARGARGRKVNA